MLTGESFVLSSKEGTVFGGYGVGPPDSPNGRGTQFTLFEETKQAFFAAQVGDGQVVLVLHGKDSEIVFKVDTRGRAFIELTNKAGEKLRLEPPSVAGR